VALLLAGRIMGAMEGGAGEAGVGRVVEVGAVEGGGGRRWEAEVGQGVEVEGGAASRRQNNGGGKRRRCFRFCCSSYSLDNGDGDFWIRDWNLGVPDQGGRC
jgi:hypothetical protein